MNLLHTNFGADSLSFRIGPSKQKFCLENLETNMLTLADIKIFIKLGYFMSDSVAIQCKSVLQLAGFDRGMISRIPQTSNGMNFGLISKKWISAGGGSPSNFATLSTRPSAFPEI